MGRRIRADLHNHSTASDGEYTPTELVATAKDLGLVAVGLTDHDTIDGLDEAIQAGDRIGMKVVPGVEVSLAFKRSYFVGTLHLLLYLKRDALKDAEFRAMLNDILSHGRGLPLVEARVKAINDVFGPDGDQPELKRNLRIDELTSSSSTVTRRHFALALKEQHGIDDNDQINKIIGNESPAYIPSGIDMKLLTPFLKKYPICCVAAHPAAGSFPGESHYKEVLPPVETVEQLLPEFLDEDIIGLDGIEVYYPAHTKAHRLMLLEWAEKYRLIVTGGSDCHDRIQRQLGIEGMTQEELNILIDKIDSKGTLGNF